MSKKMMLLALAVASMAMLALPAAASAQVDHIDNLSTFSGTIDAGGSFVATGEPTITCNHGTIEGTTEAGGTTGTLNVDQLECHTTVFGFTAKCHTAGSPLDNTIKDHAVWHAITINNKPAMLVTTSTTEMICAGISNTHMEGSVIGTITSPACNVASNTMTVKFEATGSTQNHLEYTGVKYDLKIKTGSSGEVRTAGVNSTWTLTSTSAATVTCT